MQRVNSDNSDVLLKRVREITPHQNMTWRAMDVGYLEISGITWRMGESAPLGKVGAAPLHPPGLCIPLAPPGYE